MPTSKVKFIEVIEDKELRRQEKAATEAFRRFFPKAPPVRLYRTADGDIGVNAEMALAPGTQKKVLDAYGAVMRAIGYRRGRPVGERKVQTKLRLRESIAKALKRAAKKRGTTVSAVVEELVANCRL